MCAWSAPKTWTVGAVLTAAELNTHVRDNFNYMKGNVGTVGFGDVISYTLNRQNVSSTQRWEFGGTNNLTDTGVFIQAGCIQVSITSSQEYVLQTVTLPVALSATGSGLCFATLVGGGVAPVFIVGAGLATASSTTIEVRVGQKTRTSSDYYSGVNLGVNWLVIGK